MATLIPPSMSMTAAVTSSKISMTDRENWVLSVKPKRPTSGIAMKAPRVKMSPWAKLISSMMP